MFKCPVCHYSSEAYQSVSRHATRAHKLSTRQLYIDLRCGGVEPTCKCGCGSPVKFYTFERGFGDYVTGHNSRVDNPYCKPEIQEKSRASLRKAHADGRVKYWLRDLDPETMKKKKIMTNKMSETIQNDPARRKVLSDRMRKNRLDGTVRTLYGPEHSQWNGGTSSLAAHCHGSALYELWKFPLLKAANFQCQRCSSTTELNVHHNAERMCDIVRKFAVTAGYTGEDDQQLKSRISRQVAEYHRDSSVPGEVLCHSCHHDEHPSLNF